MGVGCVEDIVVVVVVCDCSCSVAMGISVIFVVDGFIGNGGGRVGGDGWYAIFSPSPLLPIIKEEEEFVVGWLNGRPPPFNDELFDVVHEDDCDDEEDDVDEFEQLGFVSLL